MKYKWGFIFICLIICLFTIASVVASEVNETVVANENQSDEAIAVENQEITPEVSVEEETQVNNYDRDLLESSESEDEIPLDKIENDLSVQSSTMYPSYTDYSVSVSDTTITYKSNGYISMSISPSYSSTYKYYYYLNVYDSNDTLCISYFFYSTNVSYSETYEVSSYQLDPGNYTMKIVNTADDKEMSSATLTVAKAKPKLVVPSTVSTEYDPSYIRGNIIVKINEGIYSGDITLNINGKKIKKPMDYVLDSNYFGPGVEFELNGLNLKTGTYYATISYSGNEYYKSASVTVKVVVKKASLKAFPFTRSVSYGDYWEFFFDDKVPLSKVSVKINGVSKSLKKTSKDVFRVSTMGLTPKKYSAKITFNGNNFYKKTVTNVKLTIKKSTPKIIAKKKTFKLSAKTKKYTITLKNEFSKKPISKVKVTLKVNGKTYKAKTNKKGKATFKITDLTKKGTFKAKISFKGNKYYKRATEKVKIKVKKKVKTTSKKKSKNNIIKIGRYKAKITKRDINSLKEAKKYGEQCVVSLKCINYKNIYVSIEYFPYSKNDKGNVYHLEKGFYVDVWYYDGPHMGEYIYYNVYIGE